MRYLAVLLAMAASAGSPLGTPAPQVVETTAPLRVQKRSVQPWTSRRPVPTTTTTTTAHVHPPTVAMKAGRSFRPPNERPRPTSVTSAPPRRPRVADVWSALAKCESGGRWNIEGAHSGGLQFLGSTWRAFGGLQFAPTAGRATPAQQIAIATKVRAAQGWKAWPSCSRQLGLR